MRVLKCACCGFEYASDPREAYSIGWDTIEIFGYDGCPLCPGAWIVLGETSVHQASHERWIKEGRPAEYEADDIFTLMAEQRGVSPQQIVNSINAVKQMFVDEIAQDQPTGLPTRKKE